MGKKDKKQRNSSEVEVDEDKGNQDTKQKKRLKGKLGILVVLLVTGLVGS